MAFFDWLGDTIGLSNRDQVDRALGAYDNAEQLAAQMSNGNQRALSDYLARMEGTYSGNAAKYDDAVSALADAIGNRGDFSYGRSVDQFYDPAAQQRVQAAMRGIESASAAGGNRFSSGYLEKIARKQQALASEEWRSSYDRMMQDRQQQLNEWQQGQHKINNLGTLAGLYGNDRNKLADAITDYTSNLVNNNNANLETQAQLAMGKANTENQYNNGIGDLATGAVKLAGALFA